MSIGYAVPLAGVTFEDSSAPILSAVDPIESPGSLLLVEPAHPANPWAEGIPTQLGIVPNLFAEQLATLASGNAEDFNLRYRAGTNVSDGKTLVERTDKGGFHVVPTRDSPATDGDVVIEFPLPMVSYFLANADHVFYASLWARLTKRPLQGNRTSFGLVGSQQTNSYLFVTCPDETEGTPWLARPTGDVRQEPGGSALGNKFVAITTPGSWNGDVPSTGVPSPSGSTAVGGLGFGATPPSPSIGLAGNTGTHRVSHDGVDPGNAGGWILYRAYVEDLTASGRTRSEVEAIDYALYQQHVLTEGGRYYGDSFTDAATIP